MPSRKIPRTAPAWRDDNPFEDACGGTREDILARTEMIGPCASGWLVLALASLRVAAQEPLICFGNEPSWSLEFPAAGTARFATPDAPALTYRGAETRLPWLNESAWRGKPT